MLPKHRFWNIMGWSLEEHPTRQLRAVDFPVSKHMTMLHLLLELCSILVEAFGRVPQSEEAIV
jgi:hypothetical protein